MERRIRALNPVEGGRRRGGPNAVRPMQSAGDEVPAIGTILEQVQIDHTVIDVIVVDERERQPTGRPYLTVAIDVYSRCIIGMVVTLEAPSAVSVGLCLAHAGTAGPADRSRARSRIRTLRRAPILAAPRTTAPTP